MILAFFFKNWCFISKNSPGVVNGGIRSIIVTLPLTTHHIMGLVVILALL